MSSSRAGRSEATDGVLRAASTGTDPPAIGAPKVGEDHDEVARATVSMRWRGTSRRRGGTGDRDEEGVVTPTGTQLRVAHPLGDGLDPVTLVPDDAMRAARSLVPRRLPAGLPFTRPVVRRQLSGLFGSPGFGEPGRPGLLPRDAVSWGVIGEPAGIAGGVRSLLLQATHPVAMTGVARHSRYETDPLGRLAGTSAWVTVAAFGSVDRAAELARSIRAMHARVRGRTAAGEPYAADDPELLAWVQICLTASLLAAHQLYAPRPLTGEEADRFVLEQSVVGAVLDPRVDLESVVEARSDAPGDLGILAAELPLVTGGVLPRSADELAATFRRRAPELEIRDEARATVRFLRRAPVPRATRAAYRVLLAGAGATLPTGLAVGLGFAPTRTDVRATAVLLGAMRLTTGCSPSLELARRDRR
jgi:uncharacterized protein (DUF2236 family)